MNLYLKYQSPNTFSSKDIVQLKVYQNSDKIQKKDLFIMHLHLKYQSAITFGSIGLKFLKLGHKVKSLLYQKNGLFIMHLYLKYQRPNTFGSIDMALGKVFQN
jgi:hypothetical protein